MAENSKIEWTHHTFNPWRGCTKIAAGCANCYADSQAKRNPGTLGIWGDHGTRVVASESMWREPIKWNKAAEKAGERHRVFCASMADVFEDWQGFSITAQGESLWGSSKSEHPWNTIEQTSRAAPALTIADVRRRLFALIDATPHLDWLLLTKRPENIRSMWVDEKIPWRATGRWHRDNVWLGTSISTQADADRNIPELLKCRDLSPVLFVSAEPLLGPVDLTTECPIPADDEGPERIGYMVGPDDGKTGLFVTRADALGESIDWLIVGGESGPNARPMHPDWARSLRDQCQAAGVPFFFKQGSQANWGSFKEFSSFPKELQVREFPNVYS